jgi:uncharacterized heparinase superfamily protein
MGVMSAAETSPTAGGQITDDAALWRRLRGVLGEDFRASPIYRTKLAGPTPEPFRIYPADLSPPNADRAEALAARRWRYGQERIVLDEGEMPWSRPAPSRHFADRLHRFDWLSHLMSVDEQQAWARRLVDHWCKEFGGFNPFAWRIGITADRVWNWLKAGAELFDADGEEARETRRSVLARQVRHLNASLAASPDAAARWRGACVLVVAALAYGDTDQRLDEAVERLNMEMTAQILPDGGHVSRSPERLLHALIDVLTVKDVFERSARTPPDFLDKWIRRMAPMLGFFVVGDGGLVPFNGGGESRAELVRAALERADQPRRNFMFAMKSGFQKLAAGDTLVVLDAGAGPDMPFGDFAHAGCLSFDLHAGGARLVTSCGGSRDVSPRWQDSVRSTRAHSSLSLAGLEIGRWETNEDTRLEFLTGPEGIAAKRLEEDTRDVWLEVQHGGWRDRFGLVHKRRLFLTSDGERLAGEDTLVRPISQGPAEDLTPIAFELRFHLHPDVRPETAGDAVRLIPERGDIWRFKTSHRDVRMETTYYVGRGRLERSHQIVLSGHADPAGDGLRPPNCIKWAFLRERVR